MTNNVTQVESQKTKIQPVTKAERDRYAKHLNKVKATVLVAFESLPVGVLTRDCYCNPEKARGLNNLNVETILRKKEVEIRRENKEFSLIVVPKCKVMSAFIMNAAAYYRDKSNLVKREKSLNLREHNLFLYESNLFSNFLQELAERGDVDPLMILEQTTKPRKGSVDEQGMERAAKSVHTMVRDSCHFYATSLVSFCVVSKPLENKLKTKHSFIIGH